MCHQPCVDTAQGRVEARRAELAQVVAEERAPRPRPAAKATPRGQPLRSGYRRLAEFRLEGAAGFSKGALVGADGSVSGIATIVGVDEQAANTVVELGHDASVL